MAVIDAGQLLLQPFRGQCPICVEEVVVVEIDGQDVVLELMEILTTLRCPRCASNVAQGKLGKAKVAKKYGGMGDAKPCWRCGGTRLVGEPLPSVGVAIDSAGMARWFTGHRHQGEAIHVPHVCLTSG